METTEIKPEDAQPVSITRKQKIIKETKSILLILVLVFTFRSVFFEPFRIPSGSMIPTLMIGDFILVNKFTYGFKVPFSDFSLGSINLNPIYLFGREKVKRGDVIVFKYPKDPTINYIKRVVGLPGDSIAIIDKVVYINGEPIKTEPFESKELMNELSEKYKRYKIKLFKTKTGDAEHLIQLNEDDAFQSGYDTRVIPEGKYFAMGDNRDFSYDSRFWGFVPEENIKGKAIFVWLSLTSPFDEDSQFKFRPWRIGTLIK